ncbi:hypothetical protein Bxe_B0093 [Paraburkholderia xenovorans LB400]|uniref:Uncharacterized protein n=1 Tax=Paraburkholderia xenovorans (strain LB400) TaxID=266265 RepID=Q13JA3_PARXL|nr:hypothetical protein Bxe_B0093 [Paraburkholderia xenovorans LB400]
MRPTSSGRARAPLPEQSYLLFVWVNQEASHFSAKRMRSRAVIARAGESSMTCSIHSQMVSGQNQRAPRACAIGDTIEQVHVAALVSPR